MLALVVNEADRDPPSALSSIRRAWASFAPRGRAPRRPCPGAGRRTSGSRSSPASLWSAAEREDVSPASPLAAPRACSAECHSPRRRFRDHRAAARGPATTSRAVRRLWRDGQVPGQLDRRRIRGRRRDPARARLSADSSPSTVRSRLCTAGDLEGHPAGPASRAAPARDVAVDVVLRFADRLRWEGERRRSRRRGPPPAAPARLR